MIFTVKEVFFDSSFELLGVYIKGCIVGSYFLKEDSILICLCLWV